MLEENGQDQKKKKIKKIGSFIIHLESKLGEGAFSMIYEASDRDNVTNRLVVKVIQKDSMKKTFKEIKELIETLLGKNFRTKDVYTAVTMEYMITEHSIYFVKEKCHNSLHHVVKSTDVPMS